MDGGDHTKGNKWKIFKQRFGLKQISCCGASWSFKATSDMDTKEEDDEHEPDMGAIPVAIMEPPPAPPPPPPTAANVGMNLATALAAEREFRAAQEWEGGGVGPSPGTISLIRLIDETDGADEEREREKVEAGNDSMCCVCMGRKKGAAFIPCGHTFCRVCSREIWLNRGTCPLCNRSIVEILDIF
ncbi:hypothetical protein ACHQM5_025567 [Ranunculus cassubicifolius]